MPDKWVLIQTPNTGWTFFLSISRKIVLIGCLKSPKIYEKEAGDGHLVFVRHRGTYDA